MFNHLAMWVFWGLPLTASALAGVQLEMKSAAHYKNSEAHDQVLRRLAQPSCGRDDVSFCAPPSAGGEYDKHKASSTKQTIKNSDLEIANFLAVSLI